MSNAHKETIMAATGMNHFTILTDDVPRTTEFYHELLGLTEGYRPKLGFPGVWLYADGKAVLHVMGGRTRDQLTPGVIDHMAFSATGLKDVLAKLDARGIENICRRQPESGVWQVFFFDPNGARVELDFAPEESAPAR
jgi:catechol 2,3-dioxygenase-like lactoylglutathione lyase family enzyme